MSDVNYSFAAHIVNIVEGSNGNHEARGIWLNFPATKETVTEALEQIGLSANADDKQYSLDNFDAIYSEMNDILKGTKNIDELNYLANRMSELDDLSDFVFQMALAAGICKNAKDAINLTYNTECYNAVADMKSWENIGAYLAEKNGFDISIIGDLSYYIDYVGYAQSHSEQTGGRFLEYENVYLEVGLADFTVKYDGNIENIPQKYKIMADNEKGVSKNMSDYIFKASIVNRFEYDNGNKETSGAWLYFPSDAETVKRTFEEIGLSEHASPDTYFLDDYVCGNDDLKKCFSQYESVDALNYLAMRISELEDVEMAVFQIALEAGKCKNAIDAINLTYNTEYYDVWHEISDYDDLGRNMLLDKDIILGELCEYFDLEAYAMDTERDEGGKLINGVYLKPGCTDFKKVYEGNTIYIPSEYRVTSVEYEQGYSGEKFNQTKHLAGTLHRFFLASDKDYAAKYSSHNSSREFYLADCLMHGKLDYIKNMLDDLGQTEKDVLPNELAEYEKIFLQKSDNHLENAEKAEEQNYDRIDGIINNTDKKPSIKEQLKAISNERPKSEPQPQKKPPEETL